MVLKIYIFLMLRGIVEFVIMSNYQLSLMLKHSFVELSAHVIQGLKLMLEPSYRCHSSKIVMLNLLLKLHPHEICLVIFT